MATLSYYSDFTEKAEFFKGGNEKFFSNVEAIFVTLDKIHKNGEFIFRGLSEAKYKMFNSAQRQYINLELYKQADEGDEERHYDSFISYLIEECKLWNSSTVQSLLTASGIDSNNSLAYLSYMQHFGVPTPLLDFTFNPYLALFFAIDNVNFIASNNEIDNYFSVYYTYYTNTIFEGWRHTFNSENYTNNGKDLRYDTVCKSILHILLPHDEAYKILNNTNIINQEGLFVYNSLPFSPLEELYLEHVADMKKGLLAEMSQDKINDLLLLDKFAACLNIHKSLIPAIKAKLVERGISREFVYPDPYKIKNSALDKATLQSLRGSISSIE